VAVYYSRDIDLGQRFCGVVDEALWATMAREHGQDLGMRLLRTFHYGSPHCVVCRVGRDMRAEWFQVEYNAAQLGDTVITTACLHVHSNWRYATQEATRKYWLSYN
jgi:hypothetical protein